MNAPGDIALSPVVSAAVAAQGMAGYPPPEASPYDPSENYPERPAPTVSERPNPVYGLVRQALRDLGLDAARFGTGAWNPIGALVAPGARIVVKPNWVLDHNEGPWGTDCLVTHASVLRAVLDYALLAKPAEIAVGDAPLQGCDFGALLALGSRAVVEHLAARGAPVRIADFRRTILVRRGHSLEVSEDVRPLDQYVLVDLGADSLLEPISRDAQKFRVTMYDPRRMSENHRPGVHRYLIAREMLSSDLVINLPKLKTHKKAGITGALKNLVGVNGNKDYLPHHRKGPRSLGGDNYERFSPIRMLAEEVLDFGNRHLHRRVVNRECNRLAYYLLAADRRLGGLGEVEGGWHGNDTVWRMCLDLNHIVLYADTEGRLHDVPVRRQLSVMDAIVAGECEGPLRPEPRSLNMVLAALNPAAIDCVAATVMGFDPDRIPIIARAFEAGSRPIARFTPAEIQVTLNGEKTSLENLAAHGGSFKPSQGWAGHIERPQAAQRSSVVRRQAP